MFVFGAFCGEPASACVGRPSAHVASKPCGLSVFALILVKPHLFTNRGSVKTLEKKFKFFSNVAPNS